MAIPAFGLKYKVPYTTHQGANREIRIYKDGYAATPILWKGGKTPWSLSKGDTDDVFGNLIVSGVATIEVLIEYQLEITEFLEERQSHLVHWYDLDNDKILWSGWIEPYDGRKPYTEAPHYVTLKATCGLAQLKKVRYQHTINENPKKVALEVIRKCLFLTGHSLNINTSLFTLEVTMPAGSDPLMGYRLNTNRYLLSNGQRMYAYDILLDLMERHNCELFQENNEWIIRSIPDNARGYLSQKNYLPGGTFNLQRTPAVDYEINNDKALSLKVGSVTALRPIKRWSAKADLLPYTNPIVNGDLLEMDANGFVGWNLVPMFGQWSSFLTGKKESPNGLNINGTIYSPDIIRIKQNFWGKKSEQLVEPARYVEAPPLTFNQWMTTTIVKILYRLEVPFNRASENINLCTSIWSERSDGTDRVWLQRNGTWNHKWDVITTKGATPELDIAPSELKLEVPTALINQRVIGTPFKAPYEIIHVRIYQALTFAPNATDNQINIKIFSVGVAINEGIGIEMPTSVSYSLQTDSVVEDENNEISLMTGEVSGAYLSGIMLRLNEDTNTTNWKRIGYTEKKTSIGSMITDRIAMTGHPLGTVQCSIKVKVGEDAVDIFQYQNYLRYVDIDPDQRYKITRYSLDDLRGIITVNTIELKHADAPVVSGITRLGDSDVTYDNTGDSTSVGPVIVPIADGTTNPADVQDNARINFELLPTITFIAGVPDIQDLNLLEFLYPDAEEEGDIPDLSGFSIMIFSKPDFINEILIEGLTLTIDASPKTSGQYSIPYLISDPELGESSSGSIVVIVEPNEELIEAWPPVFDPPLPTLFFEVGKVTTDGFVITDYMPEDLVYEHLSYRIMGKPEWVSDQSVVFGEVSVTGKPVKIETRYLTLEMTDAIGRIHVEEITLACIKKTQLKHTLLDRGIDGSGIIGVIPGSFENPGKIDIESVVTGFHDKVERSLVGGGPSGAAVNETNNIAVTENNLGTYLMFPDTDGIVTPVGQYKYILRSLRGTRLVTEDIIPFTLYDDEYLSKLSAELWDSTKDEVIGVIDPSGKSAFKKPASFDPKIIVSELPHTKITLTYSKDGVQVLVKEIPVMPAADDGEYNLFDEIIPAESGKFDLLIDIENAGVPVYQRLATWTIIPAEVLPGPGIQLVTARDNSINFDVLADLPLINSEFDLPDNYNFNIPLPVDESGALIDFDEKQDLFFDTTSGSAVEVDLFLYTNLPQVVKYAEDEDKAETLLFGNLTSLDLGKLHRAPSKVRVKVIYRKAGVVVAIQQADVSFRVPLEPGDYSGLRFVTFNDDSGDVSVIDTNIPKEGRQYILPEYPLKWSASARGINGELFDKVVVQLKKDGLMLHGFFTGAVTIFNSPTPVTELDADDLAYIIGFPNDDNLRFLYNDANEEVLIDDVGLYEVAASFFLGSVEVGTLVSEFELTDDEPDDLEYEPVDFQAIFDELFGLKTTDDLPEGEDNLYFEEIRVLDTILVGLPAGVNSPITEGHSVLQAFADLQKQIDELVTGGGGRYVSLNPLLGYASDTMASFNLGSVINSSQFYVTNLIDGPFANNGFVSTVSRNGSSHFQTVGSETVEDSFWWRRKSGGVAGAWYKGASQSWTNVNYMSYINFPVYFNAAFNLRKTDVEAWVRATPLTGINTSLTGSITATDSVLSAIGKLTAKTVSAYNRWISSPAELVNMNNVRKGGVATWDATTANAPTAYGTALTFIGNSLTGDATSNSTFINQLMAGTDSNLFFRQSINNWDSFVATYQIWTSKQFTSTNITNWNTAFGWGNHAGLYSLLSHTHTFASLTSKPTTVLGYGITDFDDRVRATALTGLSTGTSTAVTATDSILVAIGKLSAKATVLDNRWISNPAEASNMNNIRKGGVSTWDVSAVNKPANYGTALTFIGNSNTGDATSNSTFINQVMASTTADLYFRQSINDWDTFTANYQIWTSKQFTSTNISNWNTAFGWGNHAGLYSLLGHTHTFASLTSKPTDLAGYGITDAYTKTYIDSIDRVPGFRIISAGTGLTGGGNLYADRSFAVIYGTAAGTSAQGNDTRINNGQTAYTWGDHNGLYYTKAYIDAIDRVPGSRVLYAGVGLNGGGNLYADRTFNVTFGSAAGEVAQGNDSRINNGQTAFTWGNHAGLYASASHTHTFASLTSKPDTLAGYGITDAYNKTYIDAIDRVPGSRILYAGAGLSGGGNLYADRTFNVVFGSGAGEVAQGNDSRINNGQTAFGWGNHAGLYLSNGATITINGNTYNLNTNPNLGTIGGGGVTGSGTNTYLSFWNGSTSLSATDIYFNGTIYGVGGFFSSYHKMTVTGGLFISDVSTSSDPSAVMQAQSTTRGFLLPRMTRAQRLAIASPAVGLKVWQTDVVGGSAVGEKTHVGSGVWIANSVYFD